MKSGSLGGQAVLNVKILSLKTMVMCLSLHEFLCITPCRSLLRPNEGAGSTGTGVVGGSEAVGRC